MRRVAFGAAVVIALATVASLAAAPITADDHPTLAGPAMGTTWRVALRSPVAGLTTGAVHREIERVLADIDQAASTWRDDSDVSRFNRAGPGEWIPIAPDLAAIIDVARRMHERSGGAFDITVGPLVKLWRSGPPPTATDLAAARGRVGLRLVEVRSAEEGRAAAIMKTVAGVELDLDGIAPGHAVDRIGARLTALGSSGHLVELGGEVRAWGTRPDGGAWRVAVRSVDSGRGAPRVVELAPGQALATSTLRPGGGAIDPRSGLPVQRPARSVSVVAESCAEADAWAVAAVVLDLDADDRGLVSGPSAPSTRADPPAATPRGP
jgi:thiamine biosynthesis lipoprotein